MPRAAREPQEAGGGAGFSLIEVLVALAVMAATLAAILSVTATNARAARTLEGRAALMAVARAVEAGIPPRADLAPGTLEGEISGHRWRMDIRPMPVAAKESQEPQREPGGQPERQPASPAEAVRWVPLSVAIRVRAPSGATFDLETVRLAGGRAGSAPP